MSAKKKVKSGFHWIHLFAILILGGYYFISKVNLVHALSQKTFLMSFFQLFVFGSFFSLLFLYIFSHDKFFPLARELERTEAKKEKKFLKKYFHHGKIFATFLIATVGGPVFSSLTARILLNNLASKYFIVFLANIPSTILALSLGRGIVQLVHF